MSETYDVTADGLAEGVAAARVALGRGELVVTPTDTVYGIAADAFQPAAVRALVDAKGRTLASPPPVLIPDLGAAEALAESIHLDLRPLLEAHWPGALTVIVAARTGLDWDLGETRGTVALRIPDDAFTLELLRATGPLACSSANLTGRPPAETAAAARDMLGDAVAVYLDGGPRGAVSSTIVDASNLHRPQGRLRIVREGVIPAEEIRRIVGAERCA